MTTPAPPEYIANLSKSKIMASKKTYKELLEDPRWQKKRLEILQRDGWACTECGDSTERLEIHHHFYDGRAPWQYSGSEVTTLCRTCHAAKTDPNVKRKPRKIEEIIREPRQGIIERVEPSVMVSLNRQLDQLQDKLKDPSTPFELQEEILKNIMFLQGKRKELVNG